jgi:hypothetical protein
MFLLLLAVTAPLLLMLLQQLHQGLAPPSTTTGS